MHDDLRQARSDLMALEGELGEAATARATAQAQLRDCQDMLEELQQFATGLQGEGQATVARLEVRVGWQNVQPGVHLQLQHAGKAWLQMWGGNGCGCMPQSPGCGCGWLRSRNCRDSCSQLGNNDGAAG